MAKLYITEFANMAVSLNGLPVAVGPLPSAIDQTPVIIGAAADSAAFANSTRYIRVHADAICSIALKPGGTGSAATTSNARLAADQTEYFGVNPGDKISVIANT